MRLFARVWLAFGLEAPGGLANLSRDDEHARPTDGGVNKPTILNCKFKIAQNPQTDEQPFKLQQP